ncbi:hypothetical protein CVT26_014041 [Gymnopilus dilepis]|uniref:Protein kinase domain-containing protein n=1 Tax=Gymnopilus dilepis TaxID=231916 RepID=A0A409VX53_9AGAR|nr:hypothetical protein CVT26_014041 [Gymnopilus dilepis]
MSISLDCLILGDDRGLMFTIKAEPTDDVETLKRLIKAKKSIRLSHADALDLELWKVEIPVVNLRREPEILNASFSDYEEMFPPSEALKFFFPTVPNRCLHVIVKAPAPPPPSGVASDPSQLISLNYLIQGDGRDRIATVKVLKTDNVAALKNSIKADKAPYLDHIPASDLDLWHVSLPTDNLAPEPNQMKAILSDDQKLPTTAILSTIFQDIAPDHVHVILKSPYLSLNCLVFDNGIRTWVNIEILKTKNVSALIKDIAEHAGIVSQGNKLQGVELWKVSFPLKDKDTHTPQFRGPSLQANRKLSDLFPSVLDPDRIHVVVRHATPAGPPRPPPSAYTQQVLPIDQLGQARMAFCAKRRPAAPSTDGMPQTFLAAQQDANKKIPCNRPSPDVTSLPLSLLDEVFGQFELDAENCEPTPDEAKFAVAFRAKMTDIYTLESGRQTALYKVFKDHGINIDALKINAKYTTDGGLTSGGFVYMVAELKNEVGSSAAELFFQAILYFLEATREFAQKHANFHFPCIIVLVFGPYVAFAGAAWMDRPTVQMLSPAIACHYQNTDIRMENILVRHIAAFLRALRSLEMIYRTFDANKDALRNNPTHPYPTSFVQKDGRRIEFEYSKRVEDRNMFFGHMKGTPICIKFVPSYSQEAHEFLAKGKYAPQLYAVERLVGNLYMVVMENVSGDYISLFNLVQHNSDFRTADLYQDARDALSSKVGEALAKLHQAGLVHGDIRNTNIMVKAQNMNGFNDVSSFLIVDFDSSGKIGDAKYPYTLNTVSVRRPEEAVGGALMKAEHDIEMLGNIWKPELLNPELLA